MISDMTRIWEDRRFVRWWYIGIYGHIAMLTVFIGGNVLFLATHFYQDSVLGHRVRPPSLVLGAATGVTIVFLVIVYWWLMWATPVPTIFERKLNRVIQRRRNMIKTVATPQTHVTVQHTSGFYFRESNILPSLSSPLGPCLGDVVYSFKNEVSRYTPELRYTSIVIEDGRLPPGRSKAGRTALDTIIRNAISNASIGEYEPTSLPTGSTIPWLVLFCSLLGILFFLVFSVSLLIGISSPPALGDALLYGVSVFGIALFAYMGLRELGLFPLPLFRGECSAEKTRVFHGFRWKTFEPGRDLAIVRFTSDQEADIAFLGADGSHATARVGGKYLDHFIACWARPGAKTAASS